MRFPSTQWHDHNFSTVWPLASSQNRHFLQHRTPAHMKITIYKKEARFVLRCEDKRSHENRKDERKCKLDNVLSNYDEESSRSENPASWEFKRRSQINQCALHNSISDGTTPLFGVLENSRERCTQPAKTMSPAPTAAERRSPSGRKKVSWSQKANGTSI